MFVWMKFRDHFNLYVLESIIQDFVYYNNECNADPAQALLASSTSRGFRKRRLAVKGLASVATLRALRDRVLPWYHQYDEDRCSLRTVVACGSATLYSFVAATRKRTQRTQVLHCKVTLLEIFFKNWVK